MKKILFIFIILAFAIILNSCSGCESKYEHDNEYWDSVNRQESLERAGMKDAAKKEGEYRRDRMQGKSKGAYTNEHGEDTRIYKGSKEQEADLRAIDDYFGTGK